MEVKMIDYLASFTNTDGAAFPATLGVNATGAGAGDGTEFVKLFVDDLWGGRQALLDAAGLTPDGVTEAIDTSQLLESIRMISGAPGNGVIWWATDDPATIGERVLLLTGQVILMASYPEMALAVYCGDGNNATASAFYKTSDAGGIIRSTSGTYMVMPDLRGYALRGLDIAAAVDPDGASRDIGSIQLDAFQAFQVGCEEDLTGVRDYFMLSLNRDELQSASAQANYAKIGAVTTGQGDSKMFKAMNDGTNGDPRTDSESRMVNIACKIGIRY